MVGLTYRDCCIKLIGFPAKHHKHTFIIITISPLKKKAKKTVRLWHTGLVHWLQPKNIWTHREAAILCRGRVVPWAEIRDQHGWICHFPWRIHGNCLYVYLHEWLICMVNPWKPTTFVVRLITFFAIFLGYIRKNLRFSSVVFGFQRM